MLQLFRRSKSRSAGWFWSKRSTTLWVISRKTISLPSWRIDLRLRRKRLLRVWNRYFNCLFPFEDIWTREKLSILAYRKGLIFQHDNAKQLVAKTGLAEVLKLEENSPAPIVVFWLAYFGFSTEQFKCQKIWLRSQLKTTLQDYSNKNTMFLRKWYQPACRTMRDNCSEQWRRWTWRIFFFFLICKILVF